LKSEEEIKKYMSFNLRWLGTSCFQMILPGDAHILLDPHIDHSPDPPITSDEIKRCDYLFLTHGHWDHVLDVGKLADRLAPPIFCNKATAAAIVEHQKVDRRLIHEVTADDIVRNSGFSIEVRRGVHVDQDREYRRLTGRDLPGEREIADPLERLKAIVKASSGTDRHRKYLPLALHRQLQHAEYRYRWKQPGWLLLTMLLFLQWYSH